MAIPTLEDQFKDLIYSPKGEIERVLLERDADTLSPYSSSSTNHDEASPAPFGSPNEGQTTAVDAEPEPTPNGDPEPPV